jgi:hypothetical protein
VVRLFLRKLSAEFTYFFVRFCLHAPVCGKFLLLEPVRLRECRVFTLETRQLHGLARFPFSYFSDGLHLRLVCPLQVDNLLLQEIRFSVFLSVLRFKVADSLPCFGVDNPVHRNEIRNLSKGARKAKFLEKKKQVAHILRRDGKRAPSRAATKIRNTSTLNRE